MTNKNTGKKTTEKPAKKPVEPELSDLEAKIIDAMHKLAADGKEVTSTLLRDKLGLKDDKRGRGKIRAAMSKLSKAGKVVIEQGTKGKQKRFTYKLVKP
jgi:hypothetical protein